MNALAFGVVATLLFICNPATSITVSMGTDQGSVSSSMSGTGSFSGSIIASEAGILSELSGSGDVSIEQSAGGVGYSMTTTAGRIDSTMGQSGDAVFGSLGYEGSKLVDTVDLLMAKETESTITTSYLTESGGAMSYTINGEPAAYDDSLDPTLNYHAHHTRWYLSDLDGKYKDANGVEHLYDSNRLGMSIARGMNAWNYVGSAKGEKPFDYIGTTSLRVDSSMYDGISVIGLGTRLPAWALAQTVVRADANRNFIEGSIEYNANNGLQKLDNDYITAELITWHELGHVVGLKDLGPNTGCPETMKKEIMYYEIDDMRSKYTQLPTAITMFSADIYKRKMNVLGEH